MNIETIAKRADFLLAQKKGVSHATPGMAIQALRRDDGLPLRVGYTVSKKVGNAVTRNRAKRRLREIARQVLGVRVDALRGVDIVLIGRTATPARDFTLLLADLEGAMTRLGLG